MAQGPGKLAKIEAPSRPPRGEESGGGQMAGIFKDKYYSVEDFGVYKKNENAEVYKKFCEKINADPKDCVFVDDSYSNLEFAKEAGMTTVRIYYHNNSAKDKKYIDYAYKGIESFLENVLEGKAA